jgi:hypothetical protein
MGKKHSCLGCMVFSTVLRVSHNGHPTVATDMLPFKESQIFHLIALNQAHFYLAFWAPFAFLGDRFSQNKVHRHTEQIPQLMTTWDSMRASLNPHSYVHVGI